MIKNLPAGVTYISKNWIREGDTSFELHVKGAPTVASSEPIKLTIPGSMLKGGSDIVATINPSAVWNVTTKEPALLFTPDGGTASIEINKAPVNYRVPSADEGGGMQYYRILEVTKGSADYASWQVASGSLPTGTTLDGYGLEAVLDGVPTVLGTYTFTLSAANKLDPSDIYTTKEFTINVVEYIPEITAGAGATHQIKDGKDMILTCSGKLEDLEGIYIDGKLVDANNYLMKSGSTILTLKASYLDALSVGRHTLKFQYKNSQSAETTFNITEKVEAPKTGDTTNIGLYLGVLIITGGYLAFSIKKINRMKR